jgi:Cu-Zn family superoxide dismutase
MMVMFVVLALAACQKDPKEPEMNADDQQHEAIETSSEENPTIEVVLKNQDDVDLGVAILTEKSDGVEIKVEADHLPAGLHGFHIHEHGVCESPDFASAGGHFNPDDQKHGIENDHGPHAGDIENLKVEDDGSVKQTFLNEHVTLKANEPNSLLHGTSLIIHQDEDDYMSDPAGNAGERIVCGVISPSK